MEANAVVPVVDGNKQHITGTEQPDHIQSKNERPAPQQKNKKEQRINSIFF